MLDFIFLNKKDQNYFRSLFTLKDQTTTYQNNFLDLPTIYLSKYNQNIIIINFVWNHKFTILVCNLCILASIHHLLKYLNALW